MTESQANNLTLEILISTMNRVSLSFLEDMFLYNKIEDLNILIINQTEKGRELISEFKNIRVINSYDKGLSKSRNLAIKNATGSICLIADDDVEYVENFQEIIIDTFCRLKDVSIVEFKIDTFTGENYKNYSKKSRKLSKKRYIRGVSSIEIAFKREDIIKNNIAFNSFFGLGSFFPSGEEYLFLKEVLNKNLRIYFENRVIVRHSIERSTSNVRSDDFIKTQAALYFIDYKIFSYLFLLKLIFFLLRKRRIFFKDILYKYTVGVKGIDEYKELKGRYANR
ncbi:hypothetical protein A8C32_07320 [Flavivirga aquatica]|uniref:Glycosyltransferase 2-like domain-containing protein n=1 Tax=Flavivirga aquatica TaxID=1849968 RepID=A0A1E5SIP3_9FLAO|nr:glycosyltransferase family A protein [Flavivirga aquatica]OEJ98984.1 hypothetical protein A8C32_07320 [Flavivirga aquatica]